MRNFLAVLALLTVVGSVGKTDASDINIRYENDDGSVTIVSPAVMFKGEWVAISRLSDLKGVCGRYGLGEDLFEEEASLSVNAMKINEKGKFTDSRVIDSNDSKQSTNDVLVSITCEPKPSY